MGLLGFLTRKSSDKNGVEGNSKALKGQPYQATTASLPPKLGAYPVAGNGPNVLESLQQTHSENTRGHEPSDAKQASVPLTNRFRLAGKDGSRPQTAPSKDDSEETSASMIKRKHFIRPQSSLGSVKAAFKEPRRPYKLPPNEPERSMIDKNLAIAIGTGTASIRSGDSGMSRAHVDLLDAQAAFNPSNFYDRLRAGGARDYGEDVADRNVGENGVNVHSAQAHAFYTKKKDHRYSSVTELRSPMAKVAEREDGGKVEERVGKEEGEREKKGLSVYEPKRSSSSVLATRVRSYSVSNGKRPFPSRTSSFVPWSPPLSVGEIEEEWCDGGIETAQVVDRRNSMPIRVVRSQSTGERPDPLRMNAPEYFPNELQQKSKAVIETFEQIRIASSPAKPQSNKRQSIILHSTGGMDTPTKRNSIVGTPKLIRIEYSPIPPMENHQRPKSAKSSRRENAAPKAARTEPRPRRLTLASMPSQVKKAQRDPRVCVDSPNAAYDPLYLQLTQSPWTTSSFPKDPSNHEVLASNPMARTRSLRSASDNRSVKNLDAEEMTPTSSGSARRWSIGSTATLSDVSSNPFRPQSRHTANTSVDLASWPEKANSSCDSLGLVSVRSPPERKVQPPQRIEDDTTPSPSAPQTNVPEVTAASSFSMEDGYLSDEESILDFTRPRGEDERELLFSEWGYGLAGAELPGLDGPFDGVDPRPVPLSPPKLGTVSLECEKPYPLEPVLERAIEVDESEVPMSSPSKRSGLSDFVELPQYDFGDSDSDEDISFDIPTSRPATALRLCDLELDEEDEDLTVVRDEKVAVSTAIQLRKEAKRNARTGRQAKQIRVRGIETGRHDGDES